MTVCLFAPLLSGAAIRAQVLRIYGAGSFLPTLALTSCMQAALFECMRRVLRGWGWGAATVLRADLDQNSLQCILQAFTWKSQAFSRLQSYRTIASDSASAITV